MYEAIVIGGGIVGSSVAFHLAAAGSETLLIDRRDTGRATDAGAGIISPETSGHASTAWYELALEAAAYYPELVETLRDAGVADTGYHSCGTLAVSPGVDDETFGQVRDRVFARQAEYGHPPADRLYDLPADEAQARFPPLAEVSDALYYRDGARVNGRTFESALRTAGRHCGLDIRNASADRIVEENGEFAVLADGTRHSASSVVVAGGAWSNAFGAQLDTEIPVEPQRGQIAHLSVDADTGDWPIISSSQDHYLVPFPDGRVVAGATRESGSGFAPHTTAAGVRDLLADTLSLAPGLADAELTEVRVGLRPLSVDGLPILGETTVSGAYVATGHGPTGLTLGPYSGKLVADMVRGEAVETALSAFSPTRF